MRNLVLGLIAITLLVSGGMLGMISGPASAVLTLFGGMIVGNIAARADRMS